MPSTTKSRSCRNSEVGAKFYAGMKQESNYEGELFDNFAVWLHGKPEEEEA